MLLSFKLTLEHIFGTVGKQLHGDPHVIAECLGLNPGSAPKSSFLHIHPGRQQVMVHVLGLLAAKWETTVKLWTPALFYLSNK